MKFKQLNEGISPVVYHQTPSYNAHEILKTNKFRLTLMHGTASERRGIRGDKVYYMSTFRSKGNRFDLSTSNASVTFKLNGCKLSNKYKGFPIDYWHDERSTMRMQDAHESEDRIVSHEQYISNAMSYVDEVHIYLNREYPSPNQARDLRRIFILLKKHNIPYFFYNDPRAYRFHNKTKAIDIDMAELRGGEIKPIGGEEYSVGRYQSKMNFRTKAFFKSAARLLYVEVTDDLSAAEYDLLYQIKYYRQDAVIQIDNEMHNNKKSDEIHRFVRAMQKYGISDTKAYVLYVEAKYKEIDIYGLMKGRKKRA